MNGFNLKNYPLVSIIFPCWNRKNDTLECLESLEKLNYPKEKLEIIIADNGSTDGSQGAIKKKFQQMKPQGWLRLVLVENKENLGHSAGTNRAYEKILSDAKYILKLDNDVVLASDSLIKSVEEMEKDKKIGVLGGKVFNYNKPNVPTACDGAAFVNFYTGRIHFINSKEPIICDHVTGCYFLVRKEAINSYFFNEDFFMYLDDVDFTLKIKKKGYKIVYNPEIKIWHKVPVSPIAKAKSRFVLYYVIRNRLLLEKKNARFYHKIFFYPFFLFISTPHFFLQSIFSKKIHKIPVHLKATKDFLFRKWSKQEI